MGTYRDFAGSRGACEAIIFRRCSRVSIAGLRQVHAQQTMYKAGFQIIGQSDPFNDPRVAVGAWYQIGLDCVKPMTR